ncbi:hypothetical protein FJT64_003335 [Amphibalanus amphitrite]|uniref:Uncharacterized protein n=1 Tax=Amphibalanus amphitrite TaxID=1232801 RepID=A0A6A4VVL1_AMPAM|nr:hypothetical protein FJT64_003335 [Amphibalanus amphitrite]
MLLAIQIMCLVLSPAIGLAQAARASSATHHPGPDRLVPSGLYYPLLQGVGAPCHQPSSLSPANVSVCCPADQANWTCPRPELDPPEHSFCCHVRADCAYCCPEAEFFGGHDPGHCQQT